MTKTFFISAIATALFGVFLSCCAQVARSDEPSPHFNELITQTFTAPFDPAAIDALVNEISRAQDLNAAEAALEKSLTIEGIPFANAERLVACYYELRLLAAARAGGNDEFDAYATRLLDDVRRSDAFVNGALQACRNLSLYDSERAKRLYLDLAAELASSDSKARRIAGYRIMNSTFSPFAAPAAASDAAFNADVALEDFDAATIDQTSARDAAKIIAKLDALYASYKRAHDSRESYSSILPLDFFPPRSKWALSEDIRNRCEERLQNREELTSTLNASYNDLMQLERLVAPMAYGTEPELVMSFLAKMRRHTQEAYYNQLAPRCYDLYFNALALQAAREGTRDAFERLVDQIAAAVKAEPNVAKLPTAFLADLNRIDPKLVERYTASLQVGKNPDSVRNANTTKNALQFPELVEQPAVLEGIDVDGNEITLDDYRGKSVILLLRWGSQDSLNWIDSLYDKYHDAGLEVVLYSSAPMREQRPARQPQQREYPCISRIRTTANPELLGKEFVNLAEYYGIDDRNYQKTILINPEGKIVSTSQYSNDYVKELANIYPEVD